MYLNFSSTVENPDYVYKFQFTILSKTFFSEFSIDIYTTIENLPIK